MPAPTFTLEYTDGTTESVRLTPRAQVDYETETGKPLSGLQTEDLRVTEMYQLAWIAAGRPDTFDSWLDTLESVSAEGSEEEDATLPT